MTGFDTLLYEKRDGIAYVTLNRPQFLNAYNMQMRDDLAEVLRWLYSGGPGKKRFVQAPT
jgi:enoyl-CoA hydratase/carnithine racemase